MRPDQMADELRGNRNVWSQTLAGLAHVSGWDALTTPARGLVAGAVIDRMLAATEFDVGDLAPGAGCSECFPINLPPETVILFALEIIDPDAKMRADSPEVATTAQAIARLVLASHEAFGVER